MYNLVKLGFIAVVLSLISCSNDFLSAPERKFCKFTLDDETKCESIHVFSKPDCDDFGGIIVDTCEGI